MSAKELINRNYEAGTYKVDLNLYPQGVYVLKTLSEGKEVRFKIIKE